MSHYDNNTVDSRFCELGFCEVFSFVNQISSPKDSYQNWGFTAI